MMKTISAIAVAAVLAGAATLLPGLVLQVQANAPVAGKTDRADLQPVCEQQSWPYYDRACLRDHSRNAGRSVAVRIVATDRVAAANPQTRPELAPLWTSVSALQTAVPAWAKKLPTDGSLAAASPVRITFARLGQ